MKKSVIFLYILAALAIILSLFALLKKNDNGTAVSSSKNIVLKEENGNLMWKYDDEVSWNKLYDLASLKGMDGANGIDGKDGIDGKNGANGKDGKDGINGKDGKDGIDGTNGTDGKTIELRAEGSMIQWKYTTDETWTDLIEITGSTGGGNSGGGNNNNPINSIVTSVNGDSENLGCYIKGTNCTNGTLMTVKVNNDKTQDFYVINDDSVNITLISASNIGDNNTTTVAWYAGSSGNTSVGPITVLTSLNTVTADWTNIDNIANYSYTNSGSGYKKVTIVSGVTTVTNSEDGETTIEGTSRARLLTYEEAYGLGCRTSTNNNCPDWLYGNMNGTNYSLTPYGYWLLTSTSNVRNAYNLRNTSAIASNSTTDTSGRGIRPVITIKKIESN